MRRLGFFLPDAMLATTPCELAICLAASCSGSFKDVQFAVEIRVFGLDNQPKCTGLWRSW